MAAIVIQQNGQRVEQVGGKLYAGGSTVRASIRHEEVTLKADVVACHEHTLTVSLELDGEKYPVVVACHPFAHEDEPRIVGAWIQYRGNQIGFAVDFAGEGYQIRSAGEMLETFPAETPVEHVLQRVVCHAERLAT